MTFSLTLAKSGMLLTPKVNVAGLPQARTKSDVKSNLVDFVSENQGLVATYRVDEAKNVSPIINVAIPSGTQQSLGVRTPTSQRVDDPKSRDYEEDSIVGQTDTFPFEDHPKTAVLLEPSFAPSFNESDELQQMQSSHLERKRRAKSPELKFPTFQKSANFDTFRPLPRPYFSRDATSVWPLRSIEESRLLQHFILNLGPWVRFRLHYILHHHADTAPSLMLAIARDTSQKLRLAWPLLAPCS